MDRIRREIARRGGLISTAELLGLGVTRVRIRQLVLDRGLTHVRKGWYADPATPGPLMAAARVGGRLTCLSAAAHRRLWIPEAPSVVHVGVSNSAAQLRSPHDATRRLASG